MIEIANDTDLIAAPLTKDEKRALWLAQRRTVIGASDAPGLLLLSRHATPWSIWDSKVNGTTIPDNEDMAMGRRFEPVILEMLEEYIGVPIRSNDELYVSSECDYFGATPDGMTTNNETVEVKYSRWSIDGPKRSHEIQVQWQMLCTGASRGYLAYLAGGDFQPFVYDRNDAFLETVKAAAHAFWRDHILTGIAPDAYTPDDIKAAYPIHNAGTIYEADEADVETWADFRIEHALAAAHKAKADALATILKAKMKTAESLVVDGIAVATWRATDEKPAFDAKRFESENPTLAKQYTITKPGSRRFLPKK